MRSGPVGARESPDGLIVIHRDDFRNKSEDKKIDQAHGGYV